MNSSSSCCRALLCWTALCFLVTALLGLVHSESTSFGTISPVDDSETHKLTGIKVLNSLITYGSFKTDTPSATILSNSLGSVAVSSPGRTVLTKHVVVSQTTKGYEWAIGIDSGAQSYTPFLLTACDNQSLIVVFPNCTGNFPQFGISGVQGNYAVFAKYDSTGSNIWFKSIVQSNELSGDVMVSNAHISCDGGVDSVFLVGPLTNGQLPFDCPSKNQQAAVSAYAAKFNQTGDCVWASAWTNSTVTAVSSDSQYLFVAGAFTGEAHFYNSYFTQKNTSLNDIYIFNVNKTSGVFIRGTQISAFYSGSVLEVTSADANSFYMATNLFWRIGDLPTILLLKGSKTGPSLAWSEFVLSPSDYISFVASGMVTTGDGSILLTGWCNGNGTINGTFSTICGKGSQTGFVSRYDSNGDVIDILTVVNDNVATGLALSVGSDNYVLAMGRSEAPYSIGSGQRSFTSTNKFDFVAEIINGPAVYCFGTNAFESSVCSGNGTCGATDTCICKAGYIGALCQNMACNGTLASDPGVCNGNGACKKNNICECKPGYIGNICQNMACNGTLASDPNVCNGNGVCKQNDVCQCNTGYTGSQCQSMICNGTLASDANVCSGNGVCKKNDTCECGTGYHGRYCDEFGASIAINSNKLSGFSTFPVSKTWTVEVTFTSEYVPRGNVVASAVWTVSDNLTVREIPMNYTITNLIEKWQFDISNLVASHDYSVRLNVQVYKTSNTFSSATVSISAVPSLAISPLTVTPSKGAIVVDQFLLKTKSNDSTVSYSFGYFNSNNQRVYLRTSGIASTFNTTMPLLGNVTVFVRAQNVFDEVAESTGVVTLYQGDSTQTTTALTEQVNSLSQSNGTQFETELTTYTNSLVTSINVISSNQTTQLLGTLIDIVQSKLDELSTVAQVETVKTITQHYNYLSESTTVQSSNILRQSLLRNDSKIDDTIAVAHNLANVMISGNSSKIQRESFSSMVSVLTDRVRQNMTEGQTSQISLPNLETVISKFNASSLSSRRSLTGTTLQVKQPSSDSTNNNTDYVQIVLDNTVLAASGATYVQGQVVANPPDQYSDKCDTTRVSPTISTTLFTANQQIQRVDSASTLIQSTVTVPSTSNKTEDYYYNCKYLNADTKQWVNDTNVCRTEVLTLNNNTNQTVVVQCMCSQPVSHTVSLDYIQPSETVDNIGVTCTNPCGCSTTDLNKKKGLKAYAIALIVLACVSVAILAVVLIVAPVVLIKLFRPLIAAKGKSSDAGSLRNPDEIERRFDSMYKL